MNSNDEQLKITKYDVLDHGFVRLVDSMGSDLSVVRAARVSYDAAWRAGEDGESDIKLLKYLWKNRHTTPFESVTFTFEVKAPIFVFRQWHRHRTWSYNELSARYKELPVEYYLPHPNIIGMPDAKNKQARTMTPMSPQEVKKRVYEIETMDAAIAHSFHTYKKLLDEGWPRELARSVLPVCTYSHMFATVNLLNLLKFLTLRFDSHAQYEIREYARALIHLSMEVVPVCMGVWLEGHTTKLSDDYRCPEFKS